MSSACLLEDRQDAVVILRLNRPDQYNALNEVLIDELVERLQEINARGTTILVIEHDMHFIGSLCGLVHVLDKGEVIASCKPSELKEDQRVVEAYLGTPRRPRVAAPGTVGGAA